MAVASVANAAQPTVRIRRTTTFSVIVLANIASVVSYRHMYELAIRHGKTSWRAVLIPLSVDGMVGRQLDDDHAGQPIGKEGRVVPLDAAHHRRTGQPRRERCGGRANADRPDHRRLVQLLLLCRVRDAPDPVVSCRLHQRRRPSTRSTRWSTCGFHWAYGHAQRQLR